jgi:hypothetical protein
MGLTLYLLAEDASSDTQEAVQNLIKAALKHLDVRETPLGRHAFPPVQDPSVAQWLLGTNWHNRRVRLDLAAWLANELRCLSSDVRTLWIWHVDGDCPWSKSAMSKGISAQRRVMAEVVTQLMRLDARATPLTDADASALADRIVPLNPHYSIEAWTYQHFAKARTLLPARSQAELAHAELDAWHDNRAAIDEVEQIASASAVGERLAKKYNKDLTAAGWPAQEVHAANASFAAFVGLLEAALKRQSLLP